MLIKITIKNAGNAATLLCFLNMFNLYFFLEILEITAMAKVHHEEFDILQLNCFPQVMKQCCSRDHIRDLRFKSSLTSIIIEST